LEEPSTLETAISNSIPSSEDISAHIIATLRTQLYSYTSLSKPITSSNLILGTPLIIEKSSTSPIRPFRSFVKEIYRRNTITTSNIIRIVKEKARNDIIF